MIHRVQANINLKALQANFQQAKKLSGHSKMAAVIKADAYGHGLLPIAQALTQADLFAVTDTTEAQRLTEAGIPQPVLILQGLIQRQDIKQVCDNNYHLVIHSHQQLSLLDDEISRLTLKQPLTFWLKMDSGMGRLGFSNIDYVSTFRALQAKSYTRNVVMMTHLANSSLPDSPLNSQQLDCFNNIKQALTIDNSMSITDSIPASSGILANTKTLSEWARPGLMLYGNSPFEFQQGHLRRDKLGLQAVMSLEAKIIAIKQLKANDNVGYCSQFICPHDMTIGIVSVGYADGYPSNTPNGTPVMVNGKRCATVGRVSMDMLAIDLSNCQQAQVNDRVTLWGDDLALDEIAAQTGILSYNLTCSIATRVSFKYG